VIKTLRVGRIHGSTGGSQEGAWPESLRSSKFLLMLYDTAASCFLLHSQRQVQIDFIYPFC